VANKDDKDLRAATADQKHRMVKDLPVAVSKKDQKAVSNTKNIDPDKN
jgi:hypothetical protein